MASPSELGAAIEPGSMEYGDRQNFEAALGDLGGAATPSAAGIADAGGLGIPSNPLDPLLAGELEQGDTPLTAGLPFGPGPGPAPQTGISDQMVDRLRILALEAQSPVLRHMARRALRATVREQTYAQ